VKEIFSIKNFYQLFISQIKLLISNKDVILEFKMRRIFFPRSIIYERKLSFNKKNKDYMKQTEMKKNSCCVWRKSR